MRGRFDGDKVRTLRDRFASHGDKVRALHDRFASDVGKARAFRFHVRGRPAQRGNPRGQAGETLRWPRQRMDPRAGPD
ncbi:MAG: hypothetical protein MUF54_09190 [Polyangiaceae bacterium]|nr:hypothetical protein [Polyangiaceae bacterium]